MMNRVLLIAYFYPPIGGAGVQRSAKFAKYLPDFGWEPYIISTTESVGGEELDPSLLVDVRPGTRVWRVPTPRFFPLRNLYLRVPRLERHVRQGNVLSRAVLKSALLPLSVVESPPADPFFWWSLRIIPLALRVIAQHKIDVIYTTSSPWSSTITGRILKQLTGKPWVADFRDPWTLNSGFAFYRQGWRQRSSRKLESAALALADQIVTAWPMGELLRWKPAAAKTERVIYNGFDRGDFDLQTTPERPDAQSSHISILHLGTVYNDRHWIAFFDAIAKLDVLQATRPLHFTFLGDHGLAKSLLSTGLLPAGKVEYPPRVNHLESLAALRNADVLLLVSNQTIVPGKTFEYIASGTPILAVVPQRSSVAEIIRSTRTGYIVDPNDGNGLRRILLQLAEDYEGFRETYYRPDSRVIQQYERRELTGQLAGVLNQCVSYS